MNLSPISAFFLFPSMIILLELGHRLRVRQKIEISSAAIEGAVFALFGLLLAFTFSGAMTRYDTHRELIVQETNAIGVAYLRLDLLPATSHLRFRQLFHDYAAARLHLYEITAPEISPDAIRLQQEIWKQAVAETHAPGASPDAAKLLLPAINNMIDITLTRENAFNMHPPAIVYLLLFVLSCCCAFMAGYGMPAAGRNWLYVIAFALAVTLTIYATLEIEYPRRGLIHMDNTDQALIGLRNSMK